MNRFHGSSLATLLIVLGALTFGASPAAAQQRVVRGTPQFVPTHFVPTHFVVPLNFPAARAVVINPFLRTSVMSLSPNGAVVAFNPFVPSNPLISFPNARTVVDPFRISPATFVNDFPNPNNVSLVAGSSFPRHIGNMWNMMNGGYGMGSYGTSMGYGGGSGYGGYGMSTPAYTPSPAPAYQPTPVVSAATGYGATNIDWPVGLRVLPPTAETDRVRKQLEADLVALANPTNADQTASRKANAMQEVKQLRERLNESGYKFASGTVADARRFLDGLEATLQTMP